MTYALSDCCNRWFDDFVRSIRKHRMLWLGLPWIIGLAILFAFKAYSGFMFDSPGPINIAVRIAHAAGWGMLPLLTFLWIPVMRGMLNLLETKRIGRWLPLDAFRISHRWLGWMIIALAMAHGIGWLVYDATLPQPFVDVLLGAPESEPPSSAALRINDNGLLISTTLAQSVVNVPDSLWQQLTSAALWINSSGLLMCAIFVLIGWSSLTMRRRRRYETFQSRHRLGYLVPLLLLLHIQPSFWIWLLLPVPVMLYELWLLRSLQQRACLAQLQLEASGVVGLSLKSRFPSKPGHYIHLRIPAIDDSWHAFSLIDAPLGCWAVKIQSAGDWGRRVAELVESGTTTLSVDVRGAFASPAAQGLVYSNCLLISAGIGVTPFLSLLRGMLDHKRARTIHFVWVVRHPQFLNWIVPLASAFAQCRHITLHWHLYLSGDASLPQLSYSDGRVIEIRRGRPDWNTLLLSIAQQTPRLAVFACGPHALMADIKRYVQAFAWPVRTEKFG